MTRFRRNLCSVGAMAVLLGAIVGCASEPEPVVVERVSLTGKMIVVKRQKPTQYVMTSDNKFRAHGEFQVCSGQCRAEEKVGDDVYCLIHSGKDDYWLRADDVIDFELAKNWFDGQLNDSPRSYDPFIIRAQVAMETGHPERAISDLNEAAKIKSNTPQPLFLRAKCYEMLGDFAKAQQDYERILKIETGNLKAFLGRARCLLELDQTDRALMDLDRALKVDPRNSACYVMRAQIWSKRGEHTAAQIDFQRAIESDAHAIDVYVARGQYWLSQKNFDFALADFLQALKDDSEQTTAMSHSAILLASGPNTKYRDVKKAGLLAAKACELTGRKDPLALDALATATAAAGQFDDAMRHLKAALDDPIYAKANSDTAKKKLALFKNKMPYTMD
jgi:Tfp pilus assembly protein PilF